MVVKMPEDGGIVCPHCGNVMTGTEAVPYGKREVVPEGTTDWPRWTLASIRNPGDPLNKGADAIKQIWCGKCHYIRLSCLGRQKELIDYESC
jgi:hypothetical protein